MDINLSSIADYKNWLNKENKPLSEIVSALMERNVKIDKDIHASASIDSDLVKKRSLNLEKDKIKGPLWGVPTSIKDNICVKDEFTTCASKILQGFKPPYNATVVEKLEKAGALLMARANMDEFAFGSSCETSFYGPTRNPHDLSRIPGGSSGGSAALVASKQAVISLGSDTGGSIRQPAAMCGVVGLKPTYGRVSRYGLIAFASSLDQIGPITANVRDAAIVLEIISGKDIMDSTSVDMDVPRYSESLSKDIGGMKIGIAKEYFVEGVNKDVKAHVTGALETFKKLGAKVVDISLPHTKYALSCYYIIAPAEASSNLARYDGVHYGYASEDQDNIIDLYTNTRTEGFGREAKRRILLGTYALSSGYYDAYYLKAQKVRTMIKNDFDKAFMSCDVILTPTSPTTAFKIGEKIENPLQMYLSDIFTIPANLAGLPAISVPCARDDEGLPIGLQLMAKPFGEETLLNASSVFEKEIKYK